MTTKRRSRRRAKKKGTIRRLWGCCKFVVVIVLLAAIGYGVWYSQQDEPTQRNSQEQVITAIDWFIELDQTEKNVDQALAWLIGKIPASRGVVISVADIEGADRYTFAGVPVGNRPLKILKNEGYIVGYDERMKNPAWVAYYLKHTSGGATVDRPSSFQMDSRTRASVGHFDYTNTGYDRGHMAPNYAIGKMFGEKAQMETFLMSNIVPQLPDMNRGLWKELEQVIAKEYLNGCHELWIMTGPIYDDSAKVLASGVAIPTGFFKIIIDVIEPNGLRALSFIFPQEITIDDDMNLFLVSIDRIEEVTGLDFLSLLEDTVEESLERTKATRLW